MSEQTVWISVGVESPPRTGSSPGADSAAHDGVCSRHPVCHRDHRGAGPCAGLWQTCGRLALESGAVLWARLRSPARWDAALSGEQDVAPNRAAPRSLWQPARPLQCQNSRLSWLLVAPAMSVAWGSHHEAASDQCSAASSSNWSCTAALARLESASASARLHAARATPTHRGEPTATHRSFATQSRSDPFPRAACPLSPLVGRAARSQRTSPHSESGDDQTVWCPGRLCHLARVGDGLTSS